MNEWIRQAEVWVRQSESWIRQQPPEQIYVAATVVAVTILLLIVGAVPNLELPMVLTVLKCCICIENIHVRWPRNEIGVFNFAAGDCLLVRRDIVT